MDPAACRAKPVAILPNLLPKADDRQQMQFIPRNVRDSYERNHGVYLLSVPEMMKDAW
jgi:hypothetical protein